MSKLQFDIALAKKYSKPGPRYTSYPPAPHFSEKVDFNSVEKLFSTEAGDASLYFHIPYCESMCWFCACTNLIRTRRGESGNYISLIEKEIGLKNKLINKDIRITQLHWGGGSPSFLLSDEIEKLSGVIHSHFDIPETAECGVEIDPRDIVDGQIEAFRKAGFNRVSLGVQDNNPVVQKAVNRIQPFELTSRIVNEFRSAGFKSVNIDLIYGLPFQTESSFEKTLNEIIEVSPDRIAVFNFAYVPWMKASQKIIKENDLPDAETKLKIFKLTVEKLTSSGYVYIGMDHFAKETDELFIAQQNGKLQRNFQGYSPFAGNIIMGFGVSSISQCRGAFLQNERELDTYVSRINNGAAPYSRGYILNEDDRIRRIVIMRLMCDMKLDYKKISELIGTDFTFYFRNEISELMSFQDDGLIEVGSQGIKISDTGRFFVRNIAMTFDANLGKEAGKYSKTV